MTDFIRYWPQKIFEDKDGVIAVKSFAVTLGTGANQAVITAVTGKRLLILFYEAQSNTSTVGAFNFLDGSGGSALCQTISPPPITNGLVYQRPFNQFGYFETSAGVGLYTTITTAGVNINGTYIEYTPS